MSFPARPNSSVPACGGVHGSGGAEIVADQAVVTVSAVEGVGTRSTDETVVPAQTADQVVATAAVDDVGAPQWMITSGPGVPLVPWPSPGRPKQVGTRTAACASRAPTRAVAARTTTLQDRTPEAPVPSDGSPARMLHGGRRDDLTRDPFQGASHRSSPAGVVSSFQWRGAPGVARHTGRT